MEKIDKFRKDLISYEELVELRKETLEKKNEQISELLYNRWISDQDNSYRPLHDGKRIKERIDSQISHKDRTIPFSGHILFKWVAVIMLPVMLFTILYLYTENEKLALNEVKISTDIGENVNLVLPDGSIVALDECSSIKYKTSDFNKNIRKLSFDGEAYFKVEANSKRPFIINSSNIRVEVVGTKFNLQTRKNEKNAEVVLDEGKVNLISTKFCNRISMDAGKMAVLDCQTGKFRLFSKNMPPRKIEQTNLLIFKKARLEEVIKSIEKNFHVNINVVDTSKLNDTFTGALSPTSFDKTIRVLAKSYHFNVIINDGIIEFH